MTGKLNDEAWRIAQRLNEITDRFDAWPDVIGTRVAREPRVSVPTGVVLRLLGENATSAAATGSPLPS